MRVVSLTVARRIEFVRPVTAFLVHTARALAVPRASDPVFEVAISEAITNAVTHGGEDGVSDITCQMDSNRGGLTLRILNGREGFTLPAPPPPDAATPPVEALSPSGYGLRIIQNVFRGVRVIEVGGRFGLEMTLSG